VNVSELQLRSEKFDNDDDDNDDNNKNKDNNNNNNNSVPLLLLVTLIPVALIMATGIISESLRHYLSNIPGKHEIKELQKTATFGTARILRDVLMYKYTIYFACFITLHVAQIVNTEQLQHCVP
jgi:heme/copper-type cytochrome/quinol oxidase subunit 2